MNILLRSSLLCILCLTTPVVAADAPIPKPDPAQDKAAYLPERVGLKCTELAPDYDPQGFFAKGVKHHITVIKKDRDLLLRVENPDRVGHYHFRNPRLPAMTEGRVSLRHMFTRLARYRNFQLSTIKQITNTRP